jgi:hypothetical protein
MSFDDLPSDWPDRPLTDPRLVADVLDLCVSLRARYDGSIVLLACDAADRLRQPFEIGCVSTAGGIDERIDGFGAVFSLIADAETDGSVLAAIARPGGLSVTSDDICWADAIDAAACGRLRLLGVHVVTPDGSRPVPRPLAA